MYLVVKFKLAGCGGSRKVQQGVRLASCAVGRLIAGSIYLGILHYTALPKLRTATSSRCPTQHRADAASDRPLDRYESALQRRQIGRRLAGPGSLDGNGGEAETRLIGKAHAPNKAQPDDNSSAEAEGKAK